MLRYAVSVNGFSEILLTKMDILSGIDEIQLAVAYDVDGERMEFPPVTNEQLERAVAVYETLEGWQEDISGCRTFDELPEAAQIYVNRIAELCDVPINTISVGPERDQLVMRV
jgi:adenylosuccinate synthase